MLGLTEVSTEVGALEADVDPDASAVIELIDIELADDGEAVLLPEDAPEDPPPNRAGPGIV